MSQKRSSELEAAIKFREKERTESESEYHLVTSVEDRLAVAMASYAAQECRRDTAALSKQNAELHTDNLLLEECNHDLLVKDEESLKMIGSLQSQVTELREKLEKLHGNYRSAANEYETQIAQLHVSCAKAGEHNDLLEDRIPALEFEAQRWKGNYLDEREKGRELLGIITKERDALESENTELRGKMEMFQLERKGRAQATRLYVDRLESENASLRGVVEIGGKILSAVSSVRLLEALGYEVQGQLLIELRSSLCALSTLDKEAGDGE